MLQPTALTMPRFKLRLQRWPLWESQAPKPEHKWTQSSFNGELIKRRKIYPSRLSSYLADMIKVRIQADYFDELISKKTASRQFSKLEDFVTAIAKELQQ